MRGLKKIFLSYAGPDQEQVKDLYQFLKDAGFTPWMDKENLLGGQNWQHIIDKAMRDSDFVVICLSPRAVERNFLKREIRIAFYLAKEKFGMDDIFIIPVRLEEFDVKKVEGRLSRYQWIDLFETNGRGNLLRAIKEGQKHRKRKPKNGLSNI